MISWAKTRLPRRLVSSSHCICSFVVVHRLAVLVRGHAQAAHEWSAARLAERFGQLMLTPAPWMKPRPFFLRTAASLRTSSCGMRSVIIGVPS